MKSTKLNKRNMLALEITSAILQEAFGTRVLIGQAEFSASASGIADNAVEVTVKGFTRNNVRFISTVTVFHDQLNQWRGDRVELKVPDAKWAAQLRRRIWHKKCRMDFHDGHEFVHLL